MDGRIGGWVDGWMDGLMDGWTDRWMDGWIDGPMGGWMNGCLRLLLRPRPRLLDGIKSALIASSVPSSTSISSSSFGWNKERAFCVILPVFGFYDVLVHVYRLE